MKFTIVENIRHHNGWDTLYGFFEGVIKILLLLVILPILIPLLLVGLIFSKRPNQESVKIENKWEDFYSCGNFKLEKCFVDEVNYPDCLDYPEYTHEVYLSHCRSSPTINELEGVYFDYQYVVACGGIWLMSLNEKGLGMSVWFIDNETMNIEKVRDIESAEWNFREDKGAVKLTSTVNKKDVSIVMTK